MVVVMCMGMGVSMVVMTVVVMGVMIMAVMVVAMAVAGRRRDGLRGAEERDRAGDQEADEGRKTMREYMGVLSPSSC